MRRAEWHRRGNLNSSEGGEIRMNGDDDDDLSDENLNRGGTMEIDPSVWGSSRYGDVFDAD